MKQLKDAFKDAFEQPRAGPPPYSTRRLINRFDHTPHNSVTALLRKAGPFEAERDGYLFTNGGWPITEEDASVLRRRYQKHIDLLFGIGIAKLRTRLKEIAIPVPVVGLMWLPEEAIDFVTNKVSEDLRNQLLDKVISAFPGKYGRCGGMAFSAYDFFLIGWPVTSFNVKPASGTLRQYIWNRLLDSLELNAATFFEWLMILHILPVISTLASAALGAAIGNIIGFPLGPALGAFLAGKNDVLGLGGADDLLQKTRDHWGQLRMRLDREAAWPVGFVYGSTPNPIDQHQVLAIGYEDNGDGTAILKIWDNNHGAMWSIIRLDFRGSELNADGTSDPLKGIICEEYSFKMPPASLRR